MYVIEHLSILIKKDITSWMPNDNKHLKPELVKNKHRVKPPFKVMWKGTLFFTHHCDVESIQEIKRQGSN